MRLIDIGTSDKQGLLEALMVLENAGWSTTPPYSLIRGAVCRPENHCFLVRISVPGRFMVGWSPLHHSLPAGCVPLDHAMHLIFPNTYG